MIADYMFNKFAVPSGHRLCLILSSGPMSSAALGNLTGKTLAELRSLPSTLATAVPDVDVRSFGFRIERSATSAYGQRYVPAFSLPNKCVYSPAKSGTCTYVVFALLDGPTATAKVLRCYQCSAGLSGAEAILSRVTVSAEDKAFSAKLNVWGATGDHIGDASATATVISPQSSPAIGSGILRGSVVVTAPESVAGLTSFALRADVRVTSPTVVEV